MHDNLYVEWAIVQAQRRDLLRAVGQDRLIRRARPDRAAHRPKRRASTRSRVRVAWRKVFA
jgi:hypothetical protein